MKYPTIVKFNIKGFLYPVRIEKERDRLFFYYDYNPDINEEIKCMEGRKYHGYDEKNPRKVWSAPDTKRNRFTIDFLTGKNPYQLYLNGIKLLNKSDFIRPVHSHQIEMTSFMLDKKRCIIAGEMGTGKTLSAIEFLERVKLEKLVPWYVAPKSASNAVKLDFAKWESEVDPQFYTYEGIVKVVKQNQGKGNDELNFVVPNVLILDESSKLKNHTTERWKSVSLLIETMFEVHGDDNVYIILMTGSPAPRSPLDWWAQCELACPGFLKEGNLLAFRNRIAVYEKVDDGAGQIYPKLVAYKDRDGLCNVCGQVEDHVNHTVIANHIFVPAKNEVKALYNRMKGLVLVKLKKDCLDLPDKIYREIKVEPSSKILEYAKLIKKSNSRAVSALIQLRELSDGFLYEHKKTGESEVCSVCNGSGKIVIPEEDICPTCFGDGKVDKTKLVTNYLECPKDEAFNDLLDQHSEIGRFVAYGGFTGTVDKLVTLSCKQGYNVIRVDGRGWFVFDSTGADITGNFANQPAILQYFQSDSDDLITFAGQADSAGMGLTLTKSPSICFFSNSFRGESRIQAEDRIHRIGMDVNRGATIYDIFNLPTDKLIRDNLRLKKKLQDITMGEILI